MSSLLSEGNEIGYVSGDQAKLDYETEYKDLKARRQHHLDGSGEHGARYDLDGAGG